MEFGRAIRRSLGEVIGLVFPAHCGGCAQVLPAGEGSLCERCAAAMLGLIDLGYCRRCGQDVGPFAARPGERDGVSVCGLCDEGLYRYTALARVGPFAPPLDDLIRRFKYAGGRHLTAALGDWQAARLSVQPWLGAVDFLAPIPLHWRRRFGRGFNQSELLAEHVGRRAGKPVVNALARPVHRPPQASLPRSRRFENVRGVFSVRRRGLVRDATVCLIDDVCTTGATLSEAARTLLAGGARDVYAAVVAVAQPPPAYSELLNEP